MESSIVGFVASGMIAAIAGLSPSVDTMTEMRCAQSTSVSVSPVLSGRSRSLEFGRSVEVAVCDLNGRVAVGQRRRQFAEHRDDRTISAGGL